MAVSNTETVIAPELRKETTMLKTVFISMALIAAGVAPAAAEGFPNLYQTNFDR